MRSSKQEIQIRIFGSLLKESGKLVARQTDMVLEAPTPLNSILNLLEIPDNKVQVVFVNHRAVLRDHVIRPGDRVSLFPREYALFADWNDFRF